MLSAHYTNRLVRWCYWDGANLHDTKLWSPPVGAPSPFGDNAWARQDSLT